jgi:integrase
MSRRGQNEGSIYNRQDGRWVGSLSLGFVNGKRRRKHFYASTRKEVQEKLTAALRSKQLGLLVVGDKQSVHRYLNSWLEDVVMRTVRPSTYRSYEQLIRVHLVPALGKIPLEKLSTQHIRAFLNQKQDEGLSSRTVQYLHAILRKALNDAVKDQLVVRNVAALVDPPRVQSTEVQPLMPAEARRFLEFIQGDRLECFFTVAVSLGLRQGEGLALRPQDIDLEKGKLRVTYALQRHKGQVYLVEPKTKKSRRTLDLPKVTITALANHLVRQQEERELCGSRWVVPIVQREGKLEPVEFLFTTTIGTPLESRSVTKKFQRILKAAGIAPHRFHDLRHTAATLLAIQGVHPKAIQAALGWDQSSMVDRYTHFVDEMRREVASKMDEILKTPASVRILTQKPS